VKQEKHQVKQEEHQVKQDEQDVTRWASRLTKPLLGRRLDAKCHKREGGVKEETDNAL
jgi:hypothetical protein